MLEEGTAEKKHVSFAEQVVTIPPTASEAPRSPSDDSLASLFGDDDTDFDKELCLGSHASANSTEEGPSNAGGTPEPEYPQVAVDWETPEFDYFNPYPVWGSVPSTDDIIATLKQAHDPRLDYAVELLWKGAYNRFYAVEFSGAAYVLKVALPVCPERKTASEVATMRWTHAHTRLPVPVIASKDDGRLLYSASAARNPMGCEWVLFRRVEGRPLSSCWRDMEFGVKQRVVIQLAAYAAAVWDRPFAAIGNLYPQEPAASASPDPEFQFGEMVSMPLFWNGRSTNFEPATGPFVTYREWAFKRLELVAREAFTRLPQIVDRRLRNMPWRMFAVVARLRVLHDKLFPPVEGQRSRDESTMLWHDNLSADNLFVDDDGVLTGVLDWDSVSCTPRSLCDLPALLQDSPKRVEPRNLHHWEFTDAPPDFFWPLLREREITELRDLFLTEMDRICLGWSMTYRYNRLRRDFEAAVQNCDHPLLLHAVESWLDAVDKGLATDTNPRKLKVWSLQERCVQGVRIAD